MKYYKNKTTGEIIGIKNMREVIDHPTDQSIKLGRSQYSYTVVYDMICPNYILGNGINSFCITYSFLKLNYKRIKKEIALEKYPDFHQYRHSDLLIEANNTNIKSIDILHKQKF
jgi:hypothetical protein